MSCNIRLLFRGADQTNAAILHFGTAVVVTYTLVLEGIRRQVQLQGPFFNSSSPHPN